MQELATDFGQVVVGGEGCIYNSNKLFPWAEDCLRELKECGIRVIILQSPDSEAFLTLGLCKDLHYDEALASESGSKLVHLLENIRSQGGKTLVVGDTPQLIEAATNAGLEAAFVCSGKHSSAFGLSAAPAIDVPANGGHFVEPEEMLNSCRSVFKAALPTFAMSCFSFSERFFFKFFAKRRAMARRLHAKRTNST